MSKKKCPSCGKIFENNATFCPVDGNKLVSEEETDQVIGLVLDSKYKIERLIGKGGMGNVYEAKHLHMGLPVAIKILHAHLIKDGTAVERFRREARSARTVNHQNAISIMDFGVTSENILYLVMELINGISLHEILKKETCLESVRAVNLMKQVCLAVDAAHQKNIVHRDLKPDNILIVDYAQTKEKVKVIDFSIAKVKQNDAENVNLTSAGVVVGTPHYISPEQAQGFVLDHRSDIYSMGIILYQCLTGQVPFNGKTSAMLLMQHIQAQPKPLRSLKPNIPQQLEDVVLRALAKSAEERQQTAAQLAEEMENALVDAGLISEPSVPVTTNRKTLALKLSEEQKSDLIDVPVKEEDVVNHPNGNNNTAIGEKSGIKNLWEWLLRLFARKS
jgi:eukaryotic-like serine/threonine-protein kinase